MQQTHITLYVYTNLWSTLTYKKKKRCKAILNWSPGNSIKLFCSYTQRNQLIQINHSQITFFKFRNAGVGKLVFDTELSVLLRMEYKLQQKLLGLWLKINKWCLTPTMWCFWAKSGTLYNLHQYNVSMFDGSVTWKYKLHGSKGVNCAANRY